MKSQIIPISFLLLSVSLIIIGFVFYNVFYGRKYEERVFKIKILDAARNIIENAKSYLKLSLVYSSLRAMREQAMAGGSLGAGPWICNGPNPLPVSISKRCLENYTKYYLTIYAGKFNTTLPLSVYIKNFSSLIYQIEDLDVLKGIYDEGNFTILAEDGVVNVVSKDIKILENLNISEVITKNRFWYMFRIFTEWASEDPFSPCICSNLDCACSSTYEEEECSSCLSSTDLCAKYALKKLQSMFDEYVVCKVENVCCMQGRGSSCLEPSGCIGWSNKRCSKKCEHSCTFYENLYYHSENESFYQTLGCEPPYCTTTTTIIPSTTTPPTTTTTMVTTTTIPPTTTTESKECIVYDCNSYYWYEARLSVAYTFTCKDYKYYISSPKGPAPLTFSVTAYTSFRDQDRCESVVKCECPSTATKCGECGPACTPCIGEIKTVPC